jgi:hypothetical protein
MSRPGSDEDDLPAIEAALAAHRLADASRLSGAVTVTSAIATPGGRRYEVAATALLPVDPDDPGLVDVAIPVPLQATVDVDAGGSVVGVDVPALDPEAAREARAFARSLIENGAVRGILPSSAEGQSPAPPVRATHELVVDEHGTKVIRRTGYSFAG